MKWIKVEDRLPEEKQIVLAYGQLVTYAVNKDFLKELDEVWPNGSRPYPFEIKSCRYDPEYEEYFSSWFFDDHCCEQLMYNVKYWMPLPELPKDG